MADGSISVFIDNAGSQIPAAAWADLEFNSDDVLGGDVTSPTNSTFRTLTAGRYLFLYGYSWADTSNGRVSPRVRAYTDLAGVIAGSYGSGYSRNTTNDHGVARGACFVDMAADEEISIEFRCDVDLMTGGSVAGESYLIAIRWAQDARWGHYITPTSAAFDSATFADVGGWDVGDNEDTDLYELQANGIDVRIKEAGTITLAVGGLIGVGTTGTQRTCRILRGVLDGAELPGIQAYGFHRNQNNRIADLSFIGGVYNDAANEDFQLEVSQGDSTNSSDWTLNSADTGFWLIEVPARVDAILRQNNAVETFADGVIIDISDAGIVNRGTSFSSINVQELRANAAFRALFASSGRTTRSTTTSTVRGSWFIQPRINGTPTTLGQDHFYSRGEEASGGGTWEGGWAIGWAGDLADQDTIAAIIEQEGDDAGGFDQIIANTVGAFVINLEQLAAITVDVAGTITPAGALTTDVISIVPVSVAGTTTPTGALTKEPQLELRGEFGAPALPASPVMYLNARGYSGSGDWLDQSGNGNDATPVNTPTHVAGAIPYFDFDSLDGFTVADDPDIDFDNTTPVSWTVYIKVRWETGDFNSDQQMLLAKKHPFPSAWRFMRLTNGNLRQVYHDSAGDERSTVVTDPFTDDVWADVFFIFDGADEETTGRLIVRVDGTRTESADNITDVIQDMTSTNDLYIGLLEPTGNPFTGNIAAVAIWRSALSDAEMDEVETAVDSAGGLIGTVATQLVTVSTVDVAGTTTLTGSLVKRAAKILTGTITPAGALANVGSFLRQMVGTVTSSGALSKGALKRLAGTLSPAGATQLAVAFARQMAGSSSPAGTLVKDTTQTHTGQTSPTGALSKGALKQMAGTISPTGALATAAAFSRTMAGTIATTGGLIKQAALLLEGTVTSAGATTPTLVGLPEINVAGTVTPTATLTRQPQLTMHGTFAPPSAGATGWQSWSTWLASTGAGLTGTVQTSVSQQTIAVAGTTSLVGALLKQAQLTMVGAATPTGTVTKEPALGLSGALTASGTVVKQAQKVLTGQIGLAGALAKGYARLMGGTTALSGTLTKAAQVLRTGATTPTGTVTKVPAKTYTGLIGPAGALQTSSDRTISVAGTVGLAGTLIKRAALQLTGTTGPAGTVTKQAQIDHQGQIGPSGTVATQSDRTISVAGTAALSGSLIKRAAKTFAGQISTTGTVTRAVAKTMTGTAGLVGQLVKQTRKLLEGTIGPAGTTTTQSDKAIGVAGNTALTGTLIKDTAKTVGGQIGPTGRHLAGLFRRMVGSIGPTGHTRKTTRKTMGGNIAPTGAGTFQDILAVAAGALQAMVRAGGRAVGRIDTGDATQPVRQQGDEDQEIR